jgi:hypothetical protein
MLLEGEPLVVAMMLVPRLFSRNRSFALFENPEVRRARRRATLLRGIVRQLAGVAGAMESVRIARAGEGCEISYRVPALKMHRRATLSDVELACVHYLVAREGVTALRATEQDRAAIDAALKRLALGLRLKELEAAMDPT